LNACPLCGGTGLGPADDFATDDTDDSLVDCPACDGTGDLAGQEPLTFEEAGGVGHEEGDDGDRRE
jgi:hypothetical protein